jgi:repressor LexA
MAHEALLKVIAERLVLLDLSERKACLKAGINVDSIRRIRSGFAPKVVTLTKLAPVLGVPAELLLALASTPNSASPLIPESRVQLTTVVVRAAVQAGVWKDAIEWDEGEWFAVSVVEDPRWKGLEKFGLVVRGTSMDKLYPEGTILICVKFAELDRGPSPGQRVICLRRSDTGDYEATVKEYQTDEKGRHVLWPRSNDPDFQSPIILASGRLPVELKGANHPVTVTAGRIYDDGAEPDLLISALVIQSVRIET